MTDSVQYSMYGGTLTYYRDLKVGDCFYVNNGRWSGEIIEVDGVNKIKIEEIDKIHDILENSHSWVTLIKRKFKKTYTFYVHMGCMCSEEREDIIIELDNSMTEQEVYNKVENTYQLWMSRRIGTHWHEKDNKDGLKQYDGG